MKITLDTKPSSKILEDFHDIMEQEFYDNCHRGTYGNYDIIMNYFRKGRAIVCLKDDKPIGFTIWFRNNKVVDIQSTWFLPCERSFYAAKTFMLLLAKEFKRRRDIALKTSCITLNGLCLACHSGFEVTDTDTSFEDIRSKYPWEKGNMHFLEPIEAIMHLK